MSFNASFAKIGDILVHQNSITQSQLGDALEEQKESNEKLGKILIDKKLITEAQYVEAYAKQENKSHVLENELLMLLNENVSLLSEDFSREHHVLAMEKTNTGLLRVAMEDPDN